MADGHALLLDAFRRRLEDFPQLADLDEVESLRLGREAAEAVIGPLLLRDLLGPDRLDTTQVARLLGITRQAVHKRLQKRVLFGLPGRGTTWFPAWQFDLENAKAKPIAGELLEAWIDASGDEPRVDADAILIWTKTPQPELDGKAPEEWIGLGLEDPPVLAAARAAARALAE